jgi:hypothetical protein
MLFCFILKDFFPATLTYCTALVLFKYIEGLAAALCLTVDHVILQLFNQIGSGQLSLVLIKKVLGFEELSKEILITLQIFRNGFTT